MTVSTSYAPLTFNGDDATTAFAVTWPFFDSSLVVTLVDSTGVETVKTITTHYTVSGGTDSDGLPATGTVTMLTAPASGETLRITRNTSKVQSSSWTNGGAYQAKTLEATLDKIILIAQETQAGINDDITGDVMQLNTSGATDYWDAESHVIRNITDGTADSDAATYGQLSSAVLASGNWLGGTGATDNALLRADGTGGLTLQASPIIVDDSGNITGAAGINALGTPSSGTLTNCTGLPVSTGVSGFGTGVATALATNVGSAGAPVVNGGALGTPSSGNLSNCTGISVTTASVTHTHTGTGASSRNLRTKLIEEMVSVIDFGAVGDGVTSDQTAFDNAVALGVPVYVPKTSSFYVLTSLSEADRALLWGPGHIQVGGVYTYIQSVPAVLPSSTIQFPAFGIRQTDLQPAQTSGITGSTGKGAIFSYVERTGGYGQYGNWLSSYLVSDSVTTSEFDCNITGWVTHQNLAGGSVYGAWIGANTPSNSLAQTYSSGHAIGMEINVGNRWADLGLLTDTGNTRETVGLKLVADVTPAPDGTTASVYHGSFAYVVGKSNSGHKWYVGRLMRTDAIAPGGYNCIDRGGSVDGNKPLAHTLFGGHFAQLWDLGTATIGTVLDVAAATVTNIFNLSAAQKTQAHTDLGLDSGTFTPAFSATGCTFSYAHQLGRYTRVGDRVDFSIDIQLNTSGNTLAANPLSITGLPVAASSYMDSSFRVSWLGSSNNFVNVQATLAASGSSLAIQGITAAGANMEIALNASGILTAAGGSRMMISGHYFV